MEILKQIQADLIKEDISLSSTLRKALVLAAQLNSNELEEWVSQELNGYSSKENLPDYRVINSGCYGTLTNGFQLIHNHQIPLWKIPDEKLRDLLSTYRDATGIMTIEENAKGSDYKYMLPIAVTTVVNKYVGAKGEHFTELMYALTPHEFKQILDTVKNRLLSFVLKLDKEWLVDSPPSPDYVEKLLHVTVLPGGNMSIYNQQGQNVNKQYNAAGDININSVTDRDGLAQSLNVLIEEIRKSRNLSTVDLDVAVEAEYHLVQAVKEAQKEKPDKTSFFDHIDKVRNVLHDATALVAIGETLIKIVEIAKKYL